MSEKKNAAVEDCKSDKCQQINGQQGDKKEPEHVSALRLDRRAAVLRHEETHPQENTAYDKGPVGGDRPAPQETLVPGDYCRCHAPQRQGLCVGRVDIPLCQAGQGARRHAVHLPAPPPQAPATAGECAHPHQGSREHRRAPCRGRRKDPLRRLGDGHHRRKGRQGRHRHPGRAHHKEAPHGQVSQRQERQGCGKARRTAPQAL